MRKSHVDYIKAIGIILVIIGHINFANSYFEIKEWIYAFHMPLFFFASGLVIKEAKMDKNFFVKKFRSLMIPFFIWGMIYSELNFRNIEYIGYGSYNTLTFAHTLTSIWFLPAMLTGVILVQIVFKITKNIYLQIGAMVSLALIGVYVPVIGRGYPWCIDVGLLAASFILLGYFSEKLLWEKTTRDFVILMIIGTLGTLLFHFNKVSGSSNVLMAKRNVGNPIYFFLVAVSGCMMVYGLARLIDNVWKDNRILDFIGTNTLAIFATHKPLIKVCEKLFYHVKFPWYLELMFTTIFVLGVCCIFTVLINYFIPVLNGKKAV